MRVEIPESTVAQLIERLRARGAEQASPSETIVQILTMVATSKDELTLAELAAAISDRRSESARDVAERLGLIGALSGGQSDLSTNPEHMEGFGE